MREPQVTVLIPAGELYVYRAHTLGLLRRYFRMSIELGRLPSLVGREFFRASVSSYQSASFEDLVIFVHDVERCVERLDPFSQQVLARVVFQEYTLEEAGRMLDNTERNLRLRLAAALDRLSRMFLRNGLLRPFAMHESDCQGPKSGTFAASA